MNKPTFCEIEERADSSKTGHPAFLFELTSRENPDYMFGLPKNRLSLSPSVKYL